MTKPNAKCCAITLTAALSWEPSSPRDAQRMSEQGSDGGKIESAANAVANLAKAVPIYDDLLKPAMVESGKALSVVGRAVNVALMPLRGLVWSAEQVENWVSDQVAKKLANVKPENIITPDLQIAGPTIESLRFTSHKPELSDMFAGLLAGAMNIESAQSAHPSFVEKIKQFSVLDAHLFRLIASQNAIPTLNFALKIPGQKGNAKILSFFAPEFCAIYGVNFRGQAVDLHKIETAIDNLSNLGLVRGKDDGWLTSPESLQKYEEMKTDHIAKIWASLTYKDGKIFEFERSYVKTTQMGRDFHKITS